MLLVITETGEVRIYPLAPGSIDASIKNICQRHGYNPENARAYWLPNEQTLDQSQLNNPLYIKPFQLDINGILHPDKQTMPLFGTEAGPC